MPEVEIMPEIATEQWPEPPRLLVEWSSPWEEFKTAFRPALRRSPKALAGEAPVGIFPYRGILGAWVLECLLIVAVIILPARIASLQPYTPPPRPKWDVIYYSGDELPQTADRGGAESGKSGRAGGEQAHHRTQVIKVARGDKPGEKIVDAPKVNLPHSDSAVANLLAFKSNPGPRPAEGLQSSIASRSLQDFAAVPPSPEVNSTNRSPSALTANIVAPAPEVSHANARNASSLTSAPIAPAPNVSQDKMRSAASITPTVVAPAPRETPRDLASSRVPLSQTTDVVAPPVHRSADVDTDILLYGREVLAMTGGSPQEMLFYLLVVLRDVLMSLHGLGLVLPEQRYALERQFLAEFATIGEPSRLLAEFGRAIRRVLMLRAAAEKFDEIFNEILYRDVE